MFVSFAPIFKVCSQIGALTQSWVVHERVCGYNAPEITRMRRSNTVLKTQKKYCIGGS
jgi:hypothetical protein